MSLKGGMISVPATVLQNLISNIQQDATGITEPNKRDEAIERQCNALQEYLMPADYVDPHEDFTLVDCKNVYFLNFRKRV
jgi:hypothetical protein